MIDIKSEKLIKLRDVPDLAWLPQGRFGGKLTRKTIFNWARHGLRGVLLETVPVGVTLCTTEAALLRYFERLQLPGATQTTVTPSQHRKSIARAEAALIADGL